MGRLVIWAQGVAMALGAPGLFLVAFLDGSFLSLPEVTDLALVYMVTQHKSRLLFYASSATIGSVIGCLLLYYVGRRGDQWVMRRLSADRTERTLKTIRRYGVMTVLIPSLLPPPAPFKIFVLLAGIAGITPTRFSLAVGIGRGLRFFGLALLAFYFGDQAMAFLRANGRAVSLGIVALLALGVAIYALRNRAKGPETPVNLGQS